MTTGRPQPKDHAQVVRELQRLRAQLELVLKQIAALDERLTALE